MPGRQTVRFGGDYNPEQWPREVWDEDIRLMRDAGVNLVSIGIFSWALLEPEEGVYDFAVLDEIIDLLHTAGIDVDLATPTASPPAWFYRKYPHSRAVTRDGMPLAFGSRGIVSPSSPEYRRAATAIAAKLAERYSEHPAVVLWHVHNEYGTPVTESYDDASVTAFQAWLQEHYATLETLNVAWGTNFWGQRYGAWEEIDAPRTSGTASNPAHRLDFARFSSAALLECFKAERDAIREHASQPITTNFMAGMCPSVDLWRWADEVDIVANDHYLSAEQQDNHIQLSRAADLTRSLARGKPWILMEHSTSAVNWQPRNIAKRPGEMRRNSLAHAARGADAVLFFQVRAGQRGAEKFHSALIPQAGATSRKWRESVALGADVAALAPVLGSRVDARVAIAWDWESFWAQDLDWRPSVDLDHRERIEAFYAALWRRGVTVDFVHPAADLTRYDVVFAPALYLIEDDAAANLREYAAQGGTLAFSYFSGIVSSNDDVPTGPYPGQLREVLGLVIEEFLPLRAGERITLSDGARGRVWSDDIELRGATSVAEFADGPGVGRPAVTKNSFGDGTAWYLATALDGADLDGFVTRVLDGAAVDYSPVGDVERVVRRGDGVDYVFQINHGAQDARAGISGHDLLTGESVSSDDPVPAGSVRVVAVPHAQS
ncbi:MULTISPECIES: beta-galactosidase [unclassified Pseudoclavibacter]|uniref:beta-galactosidase n=1 Tax=unclassified Pseudoclavibacter TaxID=2615177 RepID=UPI001BAA962C|nr:beta-galactosidase [Pseudoclavibacter sp. Marseille-Q4354]MBS3177455.1 beta-galactosidase [Pseudoclavibacter sp. Marseille-Q4354]